MSAVSFYPNVAPTVSVQNPKRQVDSKKIKGVYFRFISTASGVKKFILKPLDLTLDWVKWARDNLPAKLQNAHLFIKESQKAIGFASVPLTVQRFTAKMQRFNEAVKQKKTYKELAKAMGEIWLAAAALGKPVCSLMYMGQKLSFYSLSSKTILVLKGVGTASSVGSIAGIALLTIEKVNQIRNCKISSVQAAQKEQRKIFLTGCEIIGNITALTMGLLALSSVFLGVIVAAWVFLALSTLSLLLSLLSAILKRKEKL